MRTFVISVDQPIECEVMNKSTQGDSVAPELNDLWERTIFQWTIDSTKESTTMMQQTLAFAQYHRGSRLFWFDGGEQGTISTPILLGTGDAARTQWMIPYRNILPDTLVMSVGGSITGAWTLNEASGAVTFDSPPAADADIVAEEFQAQFKCYFVVNGTKLYQITNHFKYWDSKGIVIREDPAP